MAEAKPFPPPPQNLRITGSRVVYPSYMVIKSLEIQNVRLIHINETILAFFNIQKLFLETSIKKPIIFLKKNYAN